MNMNVGAWKDGTKYFGPYFYMEQQLQKMCVFGQSVYGKIWIGASYW